MIQKDLVISYLCDFGQALCLDSSTQRRALLVAMSHMTAKELAKVDDMQKGGWDAGEILDSLQKMRCQAGERSECRCSRGDGRM